MIMTDNNYQ